MNAVGIDVANSSWSWAAQPQFVPHGMRLVGIVNRLTLTSIFRCSSKLEELPAGLRSMQVYK